MWDEIVSQQETNKDEVIYEPLNIRLAYWVRYLEFNLQVLSQNPYVQKLKKDGVICVSK